METDARLAQLRHAHADLAAQLHLHKQRLAAKSAAAAATGTSASSVASAAPLARSTVSPSELAASAERHFANLRARYEAVERAQKLQSSAHYRLLYNQTRRDHSGAISAPASTSAAPAAAASPRHSDPGPEEQEQGQDGSDQEEEEEEEDEQFFTLGQY